MSDDDYGFYGKGLDGYVHYMQGVNDAEKGGSSGGGPRKNGDGSSAKGCISIIIIAVLIYFIIKTLFE